MWPHLFTVTVEQTGGGVSGVATTYLPVNSKLDDYTHKTQMEVCVKKIEGGRKSDLGHCSCIDSY